LPSRTTQPSNIFETIHSREDVPAVFVVHGIGRQRLGETAVGLYAGFERALREITEARADSDPTGSGTAPSLPPPFLFDGFWADYQDVEATHEDLWPGLSDEWQRTFFRELWRHRAVSAGATYRWFLRRLLALLDPVSLIRARGFRAIPTLLFIYLPLQPIGLVLLTWFYFRKPGIVEGFLNDVRLYLDPKGPVERDIVTRIDRRVKEQFLRLLGLGLDLRPLDSGEMLHLHGKPRRFRRVVWVAHSLGTVISYNVISDLYREIEDLGERADEKQKEGIERIRDDLVRFVTLGSPLDKVAYLFADKALRPWPEGFRKGFHDHGDHYRRFSWKLEKKEEREWWINFYHVLDPVSGTVESDLVTRNDPPANFHARSGILPGFVHLKYWSDERICRFILSRAFGKKRLPLEDFKPWPGILKLGVAMGSYVIWGLVIVTAAVVTAGFLVQGADALITRAVDLWEGLVGMLGLS
jgi:hypothetical protein